MATTKRDSKLVQYLNEAYGKEKELEAALEAHIGMTTRAPYKRRLQQHLRETKDHSRRVERRIKQLGGDPQTLRQRFAGQATAALKGPLHALRGKGEEERLLKNAKTSSPRRPRRSRPTPRSRCSPRAFRTATPPSSLARSSARRSAWRTTSSA